MSVYGAGDVMGCGILFPRDYRRDWDDGDDAATAAVAGSDAVNGADEADTELAGGDAGFSSSGSEDEQWWERPNPENGTKVQVDIATLTFIIYYQSIVLSDWFCINHLQFTAACMDM